MFGYNNSIRYQKGGIYHGWAFVTFYRGKYSVRDDLLIGKQADFTTKITREGSQ